MSDAAPRAGKIAPAAWSALAMVALVNMLNYLDRTIITVVAQPIKAEFGLTDTQLGFLTGPAFIAVYLVMSLVFGRMVDRHSRKHVLMFILVLWSGMTMLAGIAKTHVQLILARAGVGVGEGGASATSMSVISDYFPPERRSTATAIWNAVGMVGILLAFMVGGWIAQVHGWRTAFFLAGLPGLILAPVIWLVMREPRRGAMDGVAPEQLPLKEAIRRLWAIPAYRWLVVAIGLSTFGNLGILQWLPLFFIRSHGMDLTAVGQFFGPVLVSGMIVGQLAGGWLGDRLARRGIGHTLIIAVVANLFIVPAYLAVLWAPAVSLALGITFLAAVAGSIFSSCAAATVQTVTPLGARGLGVAIFSVSVGLLGQGLSPFAVGVLSDVFAATHGRESLRVALSVCMVLPGIAGLLFIRVRALTIRDFPKR